MDPASPQPVRAHRGRMLSGGSGPVLLTRANAAQVEAALAACPGGVVHRPADREPEAAGGDPVPSAELATWCGRRRRTFGASGGGRCGNVGRTSGR